MIASGPLMLTATPKGAFSSTFALARDGEPVGQLRLRRLRDKATAVLDGRRLTMANQLVGRHFLLRAGRRRLARADKRAFQYAVDVRLGNGRAPLAFTSVGVLATGRFVLTEAGEVVGDVVRAEGRGARAAFDVDLPPAVELFLLWVALAMWRRDQRRHAG